MSEQNTPSHAILVLGMHRSGTSAATRVLNLLGANLGSDLLSAQADNPHGFWEHTRAVDIHENLLTALGRSWHDVREMPEGWLDLPASQRAVDEIVAFVTEEFDGSPVWAVKDPRMCRFVPLWLRALERMGMRASALIVVRDPREVAQSLLARDRWTPARSYAMWLQHFLESYRATTGVPRAMISYDELMSDAVGAMSRAGVAMSVTWPRPMEDAQADIEAFIKPGERHHHAHHDADKAGSGEVPPLLRELFQRSCAIADGQADWATLDELDAQYRDASSLFSRVLGEFVSERNELNRIALERLEHINGLMHANQMVEGRREELEEIALDRLRHIRLLEELHQNDARRTGELEAELRANQASIEASELERERLGSRIAEHEAALAAAQTRLARANELATNRRWLLRRALQRAPARSGDVADTF